MSRWDSVAARKLTGDSHFFWHGQLRPSSAQPLLLSVEFSLQKRQPAAGSAAIRAAQQAGKPPPAAIAARLQQQSPSDIRGQAIPQITKPISNEFKRR